MCTGKEARLEEVVEDLVVKMIAEEKVAIKQYTVFSQMIQPCQTLTLAR